MLWGAQTENQNNAVHPNNSKPQQQVSQLASPNQSTKKQTGSGGGQSENKQERQVTVTIATVPEVRVNSVKDWSDGVILICTILLTIVGVIGTIVALRTLCVIQREVKAAFIALRHSSKLARAAEKTAAALMLGDRAWALIEKTPTQDRIQDPYLPTSEEMMIEQRMPNCIFYLKNYGKTPAKMIAWKYELQVGSSRSTPPDVTVYNMKNLPVFTPDMLPQGASISQLATFRTYPGGQIIVDIENGTKFLWLCGTVRYVDTFERGKESEHDTRFCYLWETQMTTPKPFWVAAGPREYTEAT